MVIPIQSTKFKTFAPQSDYKARDGRLAPGKACRSFNYGGCGATRNIFDSVGECKSQCIEDINRKGKGRVKKKRRGVAACG